MQSGHEFLLKNCYFEDAMAYWDYSNALSIFTSTGTLQNVTFVQTIVPERG